MNKISTFFNKEGVIEILFETDSYTVYGNNNDTKTFKQNLFDGSKVDQQDNIFTGITTANNTHFSYKITQLNEDPNLDTYISIDYEQTSPTTFTKKCYLKVENNNLIIDIPKGCID